MESKNILLRLCHSSTTMCSNYELMTQKTHSLPEKYSTQTREVFESPRYGATEFHQWSSRLVSAAQYEPAGRAWLTASFYALKQARHRAKKRGDHTQVFIGPGVKKEAPFWLHCLAHSSGIALLTRVLFPPSDSSDHRVGWFDASTSWGTVKVC